MSARVLRITSAFLPLKLSTTAKNCKKVKQHLREGSRAKNKTIFQMTFCKKQLFSWHFAKTVFTEARDKSIFWELTLGSFMMLADVKNLQKRPF